MDHDFAESCVTSAKSSMTVFVTSAKSSMTVLGKVAALDAANHLRRCKVFWKNVILNFVDVASNESVR